MQSGNYILSIAGFDPCGGAGILADTKTIEAHKAIGLGVCTSITYQNDIAFNGLSWLPQEEIIQQIESLTERFEIRFVKIGLVKNYEQLIELLSYLRHVLPQDAFILWDPILKASAGFEFHTTPSQEQLAAILENCDLITPNTQEVQKLVPGLSIVEAATLLSKRCAILLKGGHLEAAHSNDELYRMGQVITFTGKRLEADKRGTGCVLSSALLSNLSLGLPLEKAIAKAKQYIEQYLVSSPSKLGVHHA